MTIIYTLLSERHKKFSPTKIICNLGRYSFLLKYRHFLEGEKTELFQSINFSAWIIVSD